MHIYTRRFRHWVSFVTSSRRMSPPGPIDNTWMIDPVTDSPYVHLVEESEDTRGDYRRVPPQVGVDGMRISAFMVQLLDVSGLNIARM
jgi:hypothetical protein